jgi:colicin import membrane protein
MEASLFRGLLTSFAGHALLLGWAFLSIHRVPDMIEETPTIEATIITPSELTRLKQGDPNAKELEAKEKEAEKQAISKKEAEKPKPVIEPPPTAPPPATEPEPVKPEPPKPETAEPTKPKDDAIADKLAALPPPPPAPTPDPGPTPEEKKQLEDKLEAERKTEELKKVEEKKKADAKKKAEEKKKADEKKKKEEEKRKLAEAKKKKFDPDKITALLDKTPDKRGAPRSATAPTKPTDYTGPTAGERQGNDTVLSAREADMLLGMLMSQLKPCAQMPGGGGGIDTPAVNVEFRLRQDGTVEGEPVILGRQNTPLYNIAADATVRAIKKCAPFQLPPDKYGAWSKVTLTFDWPAVLGLR